jgi:glycosyltransferase involved in cell wall biosynthesis
MAWVFGAAALFWSLLTIQLLRHLPNLRRLPADEPNDPALPSVAVVFSARDEADRIEKTMKMLLEHGSPILEVIAVDDRSTDGTSEILARLAAEDSRLKVVRIDELPDRWLGKTHGLHVGAQQADSEWILFTDADVWMNRGVVGRALSVAMKERIDHICLFPSTAPKEKRSLLGDAFVLAFGVSLIDVMSRVNLDDPKGFAGVGAFNLVRTDLYRSFGGHEQLRLEIADDVMLGVLVRRAGGRTRAFMAPEDLECDYASGPFSLIKRLEKNHFAILRFRVPIALAVVGVFAGGWIAAIVGPFTGNPWGIAAGLAALSTMIPVGIFGFKWSMGGAAALFFPFVVPVLGVSVLHSMVKTLWQGGVRWRGTFYPLAMLREGCLDWSPMKRLTPPDLNSREGSQQWNDAPHDRPADHPVSN